VSVLVAEPQKDEVCKGIASLDHTEKQGFRGLESESLNQDRKEAELSRVLCNDGPDLLRNPSIGDAS
jgi:hypothetical protein